MSLYYTINVHVLCMFGKFQKGVNKLYVSNKILNKEIKELGFEEVGIKTTKENKLLIIKYEECFQKMVKFFKIGNYKLEKIPHFTLFGDFDKFSGLAINATTKEQLPFYGVKNKKVYYYVKDVLKAKPSYLTSFYWLEDKNGISIAKANFAGELGSDKFDTRQEIFTNLQISILRNVFNEFLLKDNEALTITKGEVKSKAVLFKNEAFIKFIELKTSGTEFGRCFNDMCAVAQQIKEKDLVGFVEDYAKWKYLNYESGKYKILYIREEQTDQDFLEESVAIESIEHKDVKFFEALINHQDF